MIPTDCGWLKTQADPRLRLELALWRLVVSCAVVRVPRSAGSWHRQRTSETNVGPREKKRRDQQGSDHVHLQYGVARPLYAARHVSAVPDLYFQRRTRALGGPIAERAIAHRADRKSRRRKWRALSGSMSGHWAYRARNTTGIWRATARRRVFCCMRETIASATFTSVRTAILDRWRSHEPDVLGAAFLYLVKLSRGDRFRAGVGVHSRHKRVGSRNCRRARHADHNSDGADVDARLRGLGSIPAPQSGFHVIVPGTGPGADEVTRPQSSGRNWWK